MKLLFSSDYHVKLASKNIPQEWARNRFIQLFEKLWEYEDLSDLHVVGGDFFDKMPTLEELELYYEFVSSRKCKTIIIPGNHEALKKNTTFLTYLKTITARLSHNLVQVIDDFYSFENIDVIPYNCLKQYHPADIDMHGDILITHVRGDIPPHVKAEVDLSLFDRWKVVLAGDLHSYDNCQRNILYPGSPLTTSFHRNMVDTGVIVLDTDTLDHRFIKLDLPQLIRKTIQAGEDMVATPPHHTIYEVEGDMDELAGIQDHDLMDKKVVKRSTDTALILDPEMTVEQEIAEYLAFILELPQETIDKVMSEYHDCIRG